jgi:selenocysteine lyase/cysteine desulfurase
MSIPKALSLLGLGSDNLRRVPVDDAFRLRVDALEDAIAHDKAAGRKAIAIVATAGTVNTGAIDPMAEIANIARREDLWLHVDGAYGALAALAVPERFVAIGECDSISLDAHKWLYQPVDCGCCSFATGGSAATLPIRRLRKALSQDPIESRLLDESMELPRRFRALNVALARYHGRKVSRFNCA